MWVHNKSWFRIWVRVRVRRQVPQGWVRSLKVNKHLGKLFSMYLRSRRLLSATWPRLVDVVCDRQSDRIISRALCLSLASRDMSLKMKFDNQWFMLYPLRREACVIVNIRYTSYVYMTWLDYSELHSFIQSTVTNPPPRQWLCLSCGDE